MKKSRVLWIAAGILFLSTCLSAQKSTVVIAEVLYDSPLAYSASTVHEGEFISLYNYEEEDVNIGGWRVQVTDLTSTQKSISTYTIPANTVLPAFSLAVIAPRRSNSTFDVGAFYGSEDSDSSGNITLYTQNLVFPDTRSRIRIYDAQNKVQDELTYDGITEPLAGESSLRADNGYCPGRPGSESVSIQRKSIKLNEAGHTISQSDYHSEEANSVQLYSFLLDEYSYASEAKDQNTLVPDEVTLTGTVMENREEKASHITSSQVIAGGKTVYLAEEEVVLGPGFEVKSGAEFELTVERASFHHVGILTYNLKGIKTLYTKHAEYIKNSGADIVSVQEVALKAKFKNMKKACGMEGDMLPTIYYGVNEGSALEPIAIKYGIGMLWNPDVVGNPIEKSYKTIATPDDPDKKRAYMVAEFKDFCFVATHYSIKEKYRYEMNTSILSNSLVNKCQTSGKPVYIAGDMNSTPGSGVITVLKNHEFEVLNNTEQKDGKYIETTVKDGSLIDLILEYNKNPYHKTIHRGILIPEKNREWFLNNISDHLPYFVKLKVK